MNQINNDYKKDRCYLSLVLFYCMGSLTRVTYLFIVNAQTYWMYKLRDTDEVWNPASNHTNELQKEFTADFSAISNITVIVTLALAAIFAREWNMINRVLACFSFYITIFLVIILFALIDTDSWQRGLFYTTVIIVILGTCNNSLFLVTLLHMCSKFPPVFLATMVSGQAMCGIFSSTVQILTLMVDGSPRANGLLYFSIGVFCIIATSILFIVTLKYSTFFQYQMKAIAVGNEKKMDNKKELVVSILRRQKIIFLSLFLTAGSTIMIQPGVTSTIRSVNAGKGYEWNDTYFVPVITFLTYSICDFSGREMAMRIARPTNNTAIFVFSVCRIVLVPLLLMCNLTVKNNTTVLFDSDMIYTILQILLGITNGFGINICMVIAPRNFKDPEKESTITIAILAAFFILSDALVAPVGLLLIKIL